MAMPMATPASAAMTKPAARRASVSAAWCGRMPSRVRRQSVAATVSSEGKRRGGKAPEQATISQIAPTTRKGTTVFRLS
jgi:hypothetical protein